MKIFKKMSLLSLLALLSNACNSPVENNEELVGNISESSEISDTDSIHDTIVVYNGISSVLFLFNLSVNLDS